ncbi:MAG: hypothetical protein ACPLSA_08745 [Caldanaerobacter sp.]
MEELKSSPAEAGKKGVKMKEKKNPRKISWGPSLVLSMRRGRIFRDKKKQANKMACRKKWRCL